MSVKFKEPKNNNYAATITTVRAINALEKCDNVVGVPVFGYQAIVGKDTQVGDLVVVFSAETQLSHEFTSNNNLYRDSTKNVNNTAKGYIEDNRRIRAIKFRGHRSDALIMKLDALAFTGYDISSLKENDVFDELNGVEICRKYEVIDRSTLKNKNLEKKVKKAFKRVDSKFLPEHYDTDMWYRNSHQVDDNEICIITQKTHGSSIRVSHIPVLRQLTWKDKIAKFFGVPVVEKEYAHVYGSRRVIKDVNNPNQNHFYEDDIWSLEGKKYDAIIPENYILYGELIGYTPTGAEIQKDYIYNVKPGQTGFYVYRIAIITHGGRLIDLPWDSVKKFCKDNGLNHVPELFRMTKKEMEESGLLDKLMDIRYFDSQSEFGFIETPLPLSHPKTVDEGVCIRVEREIPYILKAKSPMFYEYETKQLDQGVVDMETAGSVDNVE